MTMRRVLWVLAGAVAAAVMLSGGKAFGDHGSSDLLHACVSNSGALKASDSCKSGEPGVVLVTEGALVSIERRVAALETGNADLRSRVSDLEAKNSDLRALLAGVTRSGDTLTFTGMNLHVLNGLGSTATTNGTGNLVVGYNGLRDGRENQRSGSHNLVVGDEQNYTSYGGLVAGSLNTVSAPYASVSGGAKNTASGKSASISGGFGSTANGEAASVSGGRGNTASGLMASVSGGRRSKAMGLYSSVTGGSTNEVTGYAATTSGGRHNVASGPVSSVSGGADNVAEGESSSVSGGSSRTASGRFDWLGGSMFADD